MNKFLRFSLLSLMMTLCGVSFAQTTFDFDNAATLFGLPGESSGSGTTYVNSGDITTAVSTTADGITVTVSAGVDGAKTPNRVWSKSPKLRLYSGTLTVTAPAGKNISKLSFEGLSWNSTSKAFNFNATANVGTLTVSTESSNKTATWTGSANEVVLTVASNSQIGKLVVTIDGEGGGTDPTPVDVPVVDNIAAFKALADGTEAQLTLTDAEVLFASGNDAYVRDASGCIDFFKSGLSLSTNNVLNGSVIGKFTMYKTTPEFAATSNTNNSKLTITSGTPAAKTVTVADAFNNALDLVKISGVTLVVKTEGNYTNVYAVSGDNEIMVYDKFKVLGDKVLAESFIEGQAYDIEGIVVPFNETYEIAPVNDFLGDNVKKEVKIEGPETFTTSATITVVKSDSKNVVYYTLDGSDPTDVSNAAAEQYTAPIVITETTTVKVAEYDESETELLSTAEKTFTKVDGLDIAGFKALANGTESTLNLVNAQVLYATSTDLYIKDASAAIDFYQTGLSYTAGQILNGTVVGQNKNYNGLIELVKGTNFAANITATEGSAPVPTVVTIDQVTVENSCQLVTVKNVTVSKDGNNYYASVNDVKVQIYDKFRLANLSDELVGKTVDLTGLVIPYNGVMEIYPTVALGEAVQPEVTEAANIAAFKALANNAVAKLTLKDAEVLYTFTTTNNHTSTYVRDASGAIVFYDSGLDLKANDRVNGTVTLKFSVFKGLPEAVKDDATNANDLTIVAGEPVAAKSISVADAANYVCDFVQLNNVAIVEDATKYYAVEGENRIQLWNNFHFDAFNDFSAFATEEPVANVKGIVVSYQPNNGDLIYEIYPVEDGITTGIDSVVTFEKNENAPIYNLAGQRVNATYKGVVVRNGKKFILK